MNTAPGTTETVTCPVCGVAEVECYIGGGEAPTHYGDGSACPGEPDHLTDYSADCQCGESKLVNADDYREALERAALNL